MKRAVWIVVALTLLWGVSLLVLVADDAIGGSLPYEDYEVEPGSHIGFDFGAGYSGVAIDEIFTRNSPAPTPLTNVQPGSDILNLYIRAQNAMGQPLEGVYFFIERQWQTDPVSWIYAAIVPTNSDGYATFPLVASNANYRVSEYSVPLPYYPSGIFAMFNVDSLGIPDNGEAIGNPPSGFVATWFVTRSFFTESPSPTPGPIPTPEPSPTPTPVPNRPNPGTNGPSPTPSPAATSYLVITAPRFENAPADFADGGNVYMWGIRYENSIWATGSTMNWSRHNLRSQHTHLTAAIGRLDGSNYAARVIRFLGDGRNLGEFVVVGEDFQPMTVTMDTRGVDVLEIQIDGPGTNGVAIVVGSPALASYGAAPTPTPSPAPTPTPGPMITPSPTPPPNPQTSPDEVTATATRFVPFSLPLPGWEMPAEYFSAFTITSGNLPAGLALNPATGEIFGVPTGAPGTYTMGVQFAFDGAVVGNLTFMYVTIIVNDNTNQNTNLQNDYNLDPIPDFTTAQFQDREFAILDSIFANFTGQVFLNGRQLTQGEEFDARQGSTRITIRSQTFQDIGVGTHTIAAVFRDEGGTGPNVTVASQNFTISQASTGGGTTPTHTVQFVVGTGGSFPSGETGLRTVLRGTQLNAPQNPTRSGHVFAGWRLGNTAVTFPLTVNSNLSLTAAWTVAPAPSPTPNSGTRDRDNPQTSPIAISFAIYAAALLVGLASYGLVGIAKKHRVLAGQYDKDLARHNREARITDKLGNKKITQGAHGKSKTRQTHEKKLTTKHTKHAKKNL